MSKNPTLPASWTRSADRSKDHLLHLALAAGLVALAGIARAQISISHLSTYATGSYNTAAAEIVSFDPVSERIFFVNAQLNQVVALNASNPASPSLAFTVSMAGYGGVANSVTVVPGGFAVAAEASPKTSPGKVVFFDAAGTFISEVVVGAQPDMVTVTPNGQKVLVANEGEPNDTYTIDPQGTVSVIDISGGLAAPTVTTIDFTAYTPAMLPGVRIFGTGATVAQDLEPEYITVSDDGSKAFVVFQENNAVARIDLATSTIEQITSLGLKDHNLPGNGLDPRDTPTGVNIANWPVKGVYMPDAIDAFSIGGQTYVAYANEGDAREWGTFVEPRRIGNAGYVLDPTVFPNAATLKQNANLGRLNATIYSGDTDSDGDFDEIHVFGSRSFTIRDANGVIVWDSGDELEQRTSTAYPTQFNSNNSANNSFDSRSDDKGPEPEAITVAEVYGSTYAFIGLERIGGVMVYDVSVPSAPVFIQYLNNRDFAGNAAAGTALDLGPEDIKFVSAANSPDGLPFIIVGNEISGTVSLFRINPPPFKLQILHASDFEAAVPAVDDAPRFAAIVDSLEGSYPNTLKLSSGDNILPSPFMFSGEDPSLVTPLKNAYIQYYGGTFANNDLRAGIGRVDITILNILGLHASALGNHEFDLGTSELRNIIGGVNSGAAIRWFGAQFPYLSSNLNFSADAVLNPLFTATREEPSFFKSNPSQAASVINATKKIAPSTIINVNGELIGVVGVTTPLLASISSPGATTVSGPGAGTNDMALLATIVQPAIDSLRFAEGIDKIILLSHLQQISNEKALALLLNGVDVIIAGGSNTLMADATDRLRAGDVAAEGYPFLTTGLDGKPVAIVNTEGEFRYVGRLVVDFDANGEIIPASIDDAISGAYPADSVGVVEVWGSYAAAFTPGSKGQEVLNLCNAVEAVIIAKDGDIYGKTDVFLEGRRNSVRTEETNLGNLSAEANKWMARRYDPTVTISIKNGGGIRSAIGTVEAIGGSVTYGPPAANPLAGKLLGEISRLDIENSLRFNNLLSNLSLTAANLRTILEHGVAASGPGQTQGRFPQVSGVRFSYDETLPANARILNAVITDSAGYTVDTLVMNGSLHGDPARTFRVVTLNFLASGGDGYPFNLGTGRIDLNTLPDAGPGVAAFAVPGSEQDAFAEYMKSFHTTSPYALAETPDSLDTRIEEINDREDDILDGPILCTQNEVTLELTTDASGAETTYEIVLTGTNTVVCSGGGFASSSIVTTTCCLPDGCYDLRVFDSFGDGIASPGGYVLRDANNNRIIDNEGNGYTFASSSISPLGFCVPLGNGSLQVGSCDVLTATHATVLNAVVNPAVTSAFIPGHPNNANSGYQFWVTNPNAGFSRRILFTHAAPGTGWPAGTPVAQRSSFFRLSAMSAPSSVPLGVLLNVRVRTYINGVFSNFGPACQLLLPVPPCQSSQLTTTADPVVSCGATGLSLTSVIHATPVAGATGYQFEFSKPGYLRRITQPVRSTALSFVTVPLQNNNCYDVRVRVTTDGGLTFCPFGPVCTITIGTATCGGGAMAPQADEASFEDIAISSRMSLWPNPNDGSLVNLSLTQVDRSLSIVTIDVTDVYGKVVLSTTLPAQDGLLNTTLAFQQDLAPGLYLLNLQAGEQRFTERLVIR